MADIFLSDLKMALDHCITELDEIHFLFCKNPESDFTRNRKLSFLPFKICLYPAALQTPAGRLALSVS